MRKQSKYYNPVKRRENYLENKEKQLKQRKEYIRTPKGRYVQFKSKMKQKKLRTNISEKQFYAIINSPCHYCKKEVITAGYSLDRIDSSEGYTIKNVVHCCWKCNAGKNTMSQSEFAPHIEAIYNNWVVKFKKS